MVHGLAHGVLRHGDKEREMKKNRCRALLVSGALLALSAAHANASWTVVYPTGEFPADVESVQEALDVGGLVLLKSRDADGVPTAFDFGPAEAGGGTTSITKDVAIFGEIAKSARTTIRGGFLPFHGEAKVQMSLANVRFVAPAVAALVLEASSGATILGNEVTDVVGATNEFEVLESKGMKFVGTSDPGAFTGRIVVGGNRIHDLRAGLAEALVFESVAAHVTISFNRIESIETNGILVMEPGGDVSIHDNVVAPGPGSGGPFSLGNGISLYGTAGGSYRVERNTITCPNPNADGLILAGGFNWITFEPGLPIRGAVIRRNEISMTDSCCGAITIFDDVSSSTISHNQLLGGATWAVGLVPTGLVEPTEAAGNRFVGNDIARFAPTLAHALFFSHTRDNVWRGPSGTVVDLGVDNVFED
jgi:hypothetical protein